MSRGRAAGDRAPAGRAALSLVGDLLAAGHAVRLRVTGRSMEPWVPDGSVVTLRPVGSERVRRGDVVLARTATDGAVLHRVVGGTRGARPGGGTVVLKGDALRAPDPPVPGEDVLARVVGISRGGGAVPAGEVDLDTIPQRVIGRLLGAASLLAPRVFGALSVHLSPRSRRTGERG